MQKVKDHTITRQINPNQDYIECSCGWYTFHGDFRTLFPEEVAMHHIWDKVHNERSYTDS